METQLGTPKDIYNTTEESTQLLRAWQEERMCLEGFSAWLSVYHVVCICGKDFVTELGELDSGLRQGSPGKSQFQGSY